MEVFSVKGNEEYIIDPMEGTRGDMNKKVDVDPPCSDVGDEESTHEKSEISIYLPAGRFRGAQPNKETIQFRSKVVS